MTFFTWSRVYSIGVKEMDDQHLKLISMINTLYDSIKEGKDTLEINTIHNNLLGYAQFHFIAEEKLLVSNNYPFITQEVNEHNGFQRKAQEIQSQLWSGELEFNMEFLDLLRDWWSTHIVVRDADYGEFLNQREIH